MKIEKYYFHADVEKYSDRLRHMLIVVIAPILAICIFSTVNIVLNFGSDFSKLLMLVIAGSIFLGMVFTFAASYIVDKRRRRHSRYTFFDIIPCGMVFSEYAGEFTRYGDRIIMRNLYYIPFEKLESVSRDPKTAPHNIQFKGEIRRYYVETERLGYHINEEGHIEFDTAILNDAYFDIIPSVTVKNRFGNTKRLEKSVLYYWEEFKNTPEKAPFDISKYVAVRRRSKPKTSNPALEAPTFSRNWK